MLNSNLSAIFYLISSVFFILALKGLSSPESSWRGNSFGILGMIIAVVTLILQPDSSNLSFLFSAILIGGFLGMVIPIGHVISPLISMPLYMLNPSLPYLLGAALMLLASIFIFFNKRHKWIRD